MYDEARKLMQLEAEEECENALGVLKRVKSLAHNLGMERDTQDAIQDAISKTWLAYLKIFNDGLISDKEENNG